MIRFLALVLCTVACKKDDDELPVMIQGTIRVPEYGLTGIVAGVRAFGYTEGDRAIAFISSNEDATCKNVSAYLAPQGESEKPDKVLQAEMCSIMILVESGWDGGFESHWPDDEANYSAALASNIRCEMEDGDWVWEVRGGYQDWYWSGTTYSAVPDHYEWSLSGGSGDALELDMRFTRYQGSLPAEGELVVVEGEGEVSGVVTATWCEGLKNASAFAYGSD